MSQKLLRLSNWFSFVLRTSKLSHFKRLLATCNIDIFGLFIDFDNYRISSSDVDTSKVSMNVFAAKLYCNCARSVFFIYSY
ncbi:uncharacterized protein LOC118440734 isoform X2 [Vespa mandarinia]|uniref:uncharacterized protein LOC118440734 isoform X2 n=1 Tax=Vespa mandarinia TaxID=7446 RepID=UPI001614FFDA|nr:uncharacterized protein LOC118440734 isoform X2 [Vespa mandarinia]